MPTARPSISACDDQDRNTSSEITIKNENIAQGKLEPVARLITTNSNFGAKLAEGA